MDYSLRFKELKQAVLNGSWPEIEDPQDKKILQAAENGNWDEITNLLTEEIDLDKILARRHFGDITVLVAASMYGQVECVKKLVELGAGLNDDDGYMTIYQSALEYAAIGGHLECFCFLAEARLSRRVSNTDLYDDIVAASRRGDFDLTLKLLDGNTGTDLLHSWKGNNLMSLFIIHGCPPSCIQGLIDQGVDINGYDFNGFTPLMSAVLSENIDCVQHLLHLKADINIFSVDSISYFDEDGTTDPNMEERDMCRVKSALMYAASLKNVQCLNAMLGVISENEINTMNALMYSPLRWAAYFGNLESISVLLKSGALILYDHYQLGDAYALAVLSGNPDCLDILLRSKPGGRGINLYEPNTSKKFLGNTDCLQVLLQYYNDIDDLNELLRSAAHHRFSKATRLLLEEGANVECRGSAEATLLMLSSSQGSLEIMELLIKHGAEIDAQDENEDTAIMYATRDNHVECVRLLLECGANVRIKNKEGRSVFLISCINGHAEIAEILTLHGVGANAQEVDLKSAIIHATIKNDMKCLQVLFDLGADVNSRNDFGKTALIIASERGYLKVVDLLLRKGVDLNAQDDEGWTAAMFAARRNHPECLRLLMGANADVDILNQNGDTVFSMSMCGDGSCLEILLWSEKLFNKGMLKSVHQCAFPPGARSQEDGLTLKHVMLIIQFQAFEWKDYYTYGLERFVFAALLSGYDLVEQSEDSPSPVLLAFCRKDIPTLSYLLANLGFLPADYKMMMHLYSTRNTRKRFRFSKARGPSPQVRIIEQLAYRPLSLQAWSFLTISEAILLGGPPTERSLRVDSLPLPDGLKNKLKFQTRLSQTCYHQWQDIGYLEFGAFLSNTFVLPEHEAMDNSCTNWCSGYCVRYKPEHGNASLNLFG